LAGVSPLFNDHRADLVRERPPHSRHIALDDVAQPRTAPDRRQKAAHSELSLKIERGILPAGGELELRCRSANTPAGVDFECPLDMVVVE